MRAVLRSLIDVHILYDMADGRGAAAHPGPCHACTAAEVRSTYVHVLRCSQCASGSAHGAKRPRKPPLCRREP
jgi:ribosomal protein L37AE/L43A